MDAKTANDLLQLHKDNAEAMGPHQVSLCWNTLGKFARHNAVERDWMKQALKRDKALLDPLVKSTLHQLPLMNAANCSGVVYGLALVNSATRFSVSSAVLKALARKSTRCVESPDVSPTPVELALIAYSFAFLQRRSSKLFTAIASRAPAQVQEFRPQNMAHMVWSFATVGHKAPELFDLIAQKAVAQSADFTPKQMNQMLWGFSKLDHRSPELVTAFSASAHARLKEMAPKELANIVWAIGKSGYEGPTSCAPAATQLFDAVALFVPERLEAFSHQAIANIAWAFASADHAAPEMLDALARVVVDKSHEFEPSEMTMVLWAHAKLGHWSPPMLTTWPKHFAARRDAYRSSELSVALWAHASMGASMDADAFSVVDTALAEHLDQFEENNLISVAWSCAVADHAAEALFSQPGVVEKWVAWDAAGKMTRSEMTQLHQWQLWLEERNSPWPRLPPPLAKKCHAAMCWQEGQPSALQRQVELALKSLLGLEPTAEVRTSQGYSVDAVVTIDGVQVAIEVDGPSHFFGRTHKPTGGTLLKRRQLQSAGWALCSVPYFEWTALRDEEARKSYLEHGLRSAMETLPKDSPAVSPAFSLRSSLRSLLGL
jgi:hypothetical protein